MRRKVLVIAYHFPPMTVSSGVQRTLNFVRHLRDWDWEAVVLSASARAYSRTGTEQLGEIPPGMRVEHALAFDAARHLALGGRYPALLANPDRWASWRPFAVHLGRRLIRQERPAAIFSTYPIATAHLIGHGLARWSGLPWIADFRDSMFDDEYPADERQRAIHSRIDRMAATRSTHAIFTTASTREMYRERYPQLPADHWSVIPNGYDEEAFQAIASANLAGESDGKRPMVLLHSGTLYPIERDPTPFFAALRQLKQRRLIAPDGLKVRLRATGHDAHHRRTLAASGLEDIVELLPPLSYRAALQEMLQVDALLLFQAEGCNHQVPAKLYEYLRAQRPIIALTHTAGDTAGVLREAGADNILPLDDARQLAQGLPRMLEDLRTGRLRVSPLDRVERYSRARGAADLAGVLDRLADRA